MQDWRQRLLGRGGPGAPLLGLYFPSGDCEDFARRLAELHAAQADRLELLQVEARQDGGGPLGAPPWSVVPPEDADAAKRLIHKYRIKPGAPALVLLGDGGAELSRPSADQLGRPELFPWPPRTISQILAGVPLERCSAREQPRPAQTYADLPESCVKAFYFAAHWCPPCKALGPQLAETWALIRRRGHEFYLIYVSSDRSQESYRLATDGMPWLSMAWERAEERAELARALAVHGIPALRVLPPAGAPYDARHQAAGDPEGLNFPWKPAPVSVLCEFSLQRLREQPAIVLFVENEEAEIRWAESVLQPVAEAYFQSQYPAPLTPPYLEDGEGGGGWLRFLVAVEGEVADTLRDAAGLDEALPLLTAVDLPHGRRATMALGEPLAPASARDFVDAFLEGRVTCEAVPPLPPD